MLKVQSGSEHPVTFSRLQEHRQVLGQCLSPPSGNLGHSAWVWQYLVGNKARGTVVTDLSPFQEGGSQGIPVNLGGVNCPNCRGGVEFLGNPLHEKAVEVLVPEAFLPSFPLNIQLCSL